MNPAGKDLSHLTSSTKSTTSDNDEAEATVHHASKDSKLKNQLIYWLSIHVHSIQTEKNFSQDTESDTAVIESDMTDEQKATLDVIRLGQKKSFQNTTEVQTEKVYYNINPPFVNLF